MPRTVSRPPSRIVRCAALAVAFAALGSYACRAPEFDPNTQDVVLIVVDTLRADHLGAYGYERNTSPRIDRLAVNGTLFESASGTAPWTLPSIMSIMTARYPSGHLVENDNLRLGANVPTMAETFKAYGYATGAFVSHIYVARTFGFDRGFELFEDFDLAEPGYRLEAGMEPDADRVIGAAAAWLAGQDNRPVFLFVHLFDPHWPYEAPGDYRDFFPSSYTGALDAGYDAISRFQEPHVDLPDDYRQFLLDRYDSEIRFVDKEIDRLLEAVSQAGRGERTWVVVTSDHGEEFKEHGSMGHGRNLYEEVVRVPLVIARAGERPGAAAGMTQGTRVEAPVSGIDLFPTLLELAGIDRRPPGLHGVSLVPAMRGPAGVPPDRTIVSETVRLNIYQKSARRGHRKLIQFMGQNRSELYDLAADPGERHDLAEALPEERRAMLKALYDEVDVFSGAWNLTWSSDGPARRFQGQIQTTGILRSVVPLFPDEGKYVIRNGNTLSFTDAGQASDSGISFTTAPYDASVTFYLMIDGEPATETVFLGAHRAQPREMPFTLEGKPSSKLAFERPRSVAGPENGYFLWRTPPTEPGQEIELDESIRERLRSLGYAD